MRWRVSTFILILPFLANAVGPLEKYLVCNSELHLRGATKKKAVVFAPGISEIDPEQYPAIEVVADGQTVAKFFPLDGIYALSKNKNVKIESDNVSYLKIELKSPKRTSVVSCHF